MNDPENFLKRWSRRKSEATDENVQPKKSGAGHPNKSPADEIDQSAPGFQPAEPPEPEFDVSSLPSIESIDAGTDISAFMKPGVPLALRHAALRRAWSADPAIRDFMEMTENYWDAAGPEGVPGFGDLNPNLNIKRLVSEVFGGPSDRAQSDSADDGGESKQLADSSDDARAQDDRALQSEQAALGTDNHLLHRTDDVAMRNESSQSEPVPAAPRRHGGALPE